MATVDEDGPKQKRLSRPCWIKIFLQVYSLEPLVYQFLSHARMEALFLRSDSRLEPSPLIRVSDTTPSGSFSRKKSSSNRHFARQRTRSADRCRIFGLGDLPLTDGSFVSTLPAKRRWDSGREFPSCGVDEINRLVVMADGSIVLGFPTWSFPVSERETCAMNPTVPAIFI